MAYDPGLMQVPYATVDGPSDGTAPQQRQGTGWGPVIAMIAIGVTVLVGYLGYRVVTHFWFQPSPYSARRAATSTDTTVVFPQHIGHLTRMDSGFDAKRTDLTKVLPKGVEARLAAYSKSGGQAAVVEAGAMRMSPQGESAMFSGLLQGAKDHAVHLAPVDPGPMGGRMSCGSAPVYSETWTSCAYVDRGAFGVILVSDHGSVARAEVLAIRAAVEKRLA